MMRWKQVGLVPGARVRVREVRALDDVFAIEVEGRPLVITGSEGLDGVLVEAGRGGRHRVD
jgi:hypothetical protein